MMVQDPEIVQELMGRQNANTEKNDFVYNLVWNLLGESFVMTEATPEWKKKRQICGQAFYKDKLIAMTQVMREKTQAKIDHWFEKGPEATINFTSDVNDIFSKIILQIVIGRDCSDAPIKYEVENGFETKRLAEVLRLVMQALVTEKPQNPIRAMFDGLARTALKESERRMHRNCDTLRKFVQEEIAARK